MADGTLTFKTKIDTSSLNSDSKKAKEALKELGEEGQAQGEKIKKTWNELSKETGKSVDELKAQAKELAESYQSQGMIVPASYKQAYADMGVDIKRSKEEMEGLGDISEQTSEKIKKLPDGLKSLDSKLATIQGVAVKAFAGIAAGLAGASVSGIKFNATIEQYETTFKVFTGSAEKASETMQKLIDLGASTPFETTQLADATQKLMSFGFSADDAVSSLTMLGNASQGNAEKLDTITTAFGRMSSSGKVTLEDLNMMIDSGFNPLQQVAEDTGMSMAEVYDAISKGELPVETVTKAMQEMTSECGKYFGLMEEQSKTLNGMLSTLSDTVQMKLGEATEFLTQKITEALPAIISFIENLDVNQVINGIVILVSTLGSLIGIITTLRGAIAITNIINMVTQLGGLSGILSTIGATLGAISAPVLAVVAGIGALIAILVHAYATNEEFRNSVNNLISTIGEALKPILDVIIQTIQSLIPIITTIIDIIVQIATTVIEVMAEIISAISPIISFVASVASNVLSIVLPIITQIVSFISSAVNTISSVIQTIVSVFSTVFNAIVGIVSPIMNTVQSIIVGVFNAIQGAWSGLTGFVQGVFNGIEGAVNTLVSSVKGFVNGVIGGINGAIGIINMIPGVEIGTIPYLAKGGVLKRGQVGLLEGSGAEAVVPLEKNKQWIRAVAKDMVQIMPSVGAGGGQTINFNQPVQSADQVARMLRLERRYGLAGAR